MNFLSTLNLSAGEIIIVACVLIPLIGAQIALLIDRIKGRAPDPTLTAQLATAQQQAQQALTLANQHSQQLQALAMATPAPNPQPATLPSLTAVPSVPLPAPPTAMPFMPPGTKP